MEFERFVSRRGVPSVLWSHNGTSFISSEKEFFQYIRNWNQRVFVDSLVQEAYRLEIQPAQFNTSWRFAGTLSEKFQTCFLPIIGKRRLTVKILNLNCCLVEKSLVEHPLDSAISDATYLKALTPNHFLLTSQSSSLPSDFPTPSITGSATSAHRPTPTQLGVDG